jgi:hypothetical protein
LIGGLLEVEQFGLAVLAVLDSVAAAHMVILEPPRLWDLLQVFGIAAAAKAPFALD